MTKEQKVAAIEDIVDRLQKANAVYITDYSGLSVERTNQLRNRFRESNVDYRVLKNTLVRIAMERVGGYDEIMSYLAGPTAVAFTEEPSAPARVIKRFVQDTDLPKPALRAAIIEGGLFGEDQLDALASLKSKDELLGDILGLLMAPMNNVVGAIQAQGGNLVGAIKTIAEREA